MDAVQTGDPRMAKSSLSELEVLGVAAAAAAALGGVVTALSRAQANADPRPAVRQQLSRIQSAGAEHAYRPAEQLYAEAVEILARVPPTIAERSQSVRRIIPVRRSRSSQPVSIPVRQSTAWERLTARAPQPPSAEQIQALAAEALQAVQPTLATVRPRADAARRTVQQTLLEARQSELVQSAGPVLHSLTERFEEVREGAGAALAEAPQRITERAQQVREAVPEPPAVVLPAPQPVVQRGVSATKETLAALGWLLVASAVVYFVVLSEERREQLKNWACAGLEQVHLLALDFRGYEPDE
jgi:hypothetical protein